MRYRGERKVLRVVGGLSWELRGGMCVGCGIDGGGTEVLRAVGG